MSEITNKATKMKNSTFATAAAVPAMPPRPSTPAMMATMKNINAHLSIGSSSLLPELYARNRAKGWGERLPRASQGLGQAAERHVAFPQLVIEAGLLERGQGLGAHAGEDERGARAGAGLLEIAQGSDPAGVQGEDVLDAQDEGLRRLVAEVEGVAQQAGGAEEEGALGLVDDDALRDLQAQPMASGD